MEMDTHAVPEAREGVRRSPSVAETRAAIFGIAGDLRRLESQITDLCRRLPEGGDDFEPLVEIRGALHCVNGELIADAIETLQFAATRGAAELRDDFDRRRQLLAVPRKIGWPLLAVDAPAATRQDDPKPDQEDER